jgi:hypothetical protein
VNLVLAVLHVNKAAILAIEQFGVTRASTPAAGFLEDEVVVTVAGE